MGCRDGDKEYFDVENIILLSASLRIGNHDKAKIGKKIQEKETIKWLYAGILSEKRTKQ